MSPARYNYERNTKMQMDGIFMTVMPYVVIAIAMGFLLFTAGDFLRNK